MQNEFFQITGVIYHSEIISGEITVSQEHDGFLSIFIIIFILAIFIGVNYLRITNRDYLSIDMSGISIDKGFVWSRRHIRFKEVDLVRNSGSDLRLGLKSGNEVRIKLNMVTIKNIERLYAILEDNVEKN